MALKQQQIWIANEIKASKFFTLLSLLGIGLTVCMVTLFLALTTGLEDFFVQRVTEEVTSIFTLETSSAAGVAPIYPTEFADLDTDPRVVQTVPILTEFVYLSSASQLPAEGELAGASFVFLENYFVEDARQQDMRTQGLTYIGGEAIRLGDQAAIIIAQTLFEELQSQNPALSLTTLAQHPVTLIVDRYDTPEQATRQLFQVYIRGVAERTPYSGAAVYASRDVSEAVELWRHGPPPLASSTEAAALMTQNQLTLPDAGVFQQPPAQTAPSASEEREPTSNLGPGSIPISDTLTPSVPISDTSPISLTAPLTLSVPISDTSPISLTAPLTLSVPISPTDPLTPSVPISDSAPISPTAPLTPSVPISDSAPLTVTMILTATAPLSVTAPITATGVLTTPTAPLGEVLARLLAQSYRQRAYDRVDIVVTDLEAMEQLRNELQARAYRTRSILDRLDDFRQTLRLGSFLFFAIFGAAIVMALFNISMTLMNYVLKRQRRIGILKALGATDWQVQRIFLGHAIFLSVCGSLLGIGLAYLLSLITNPYLSAQIETDIALLQLNPLTLLGVLFSTTLLSLIAALLPALRASSIAPAQIMREVG